MLVLLHSLHWESKEGQNARFDALFAADPSLFTAGPMQPVTILDVGCGLGHLVDRIDELGMHHLRIVGVDIAPLLIEHAKQKHPQHEWLKLNLATDMPEHIQSALSLAVSSVTGLPVPASDVARDTSSQAKLLPVVDWAFASGTFAFGSRALFDALLAPMVQLAKRGVAFNIHLSPSADPQFLWLSREEALAAARRQPGVRDVKEYVGYWPDDFAIHIYKHSS